MKMREGKMREKKRKEKKQQEKEKEDWNPTKTDCTNQVLVQRKI
jgi:hypothetical protein